MLEKLKNFWRSLWRKPTEEEVTEEKFNELLDVLDQLSDEGREEIMEYARKVMGTRDPQKPH